MSARAEHLRSILTQALQPTDVSIEDESWKHAGHQGARESGGGHFSVTIVAECFRGRSRIERQRMVMQALSAEFGPTIHALSIRAMAPEERAS
ncbi:MAG TPA: BolA family protein [Mariprofundaceae bacterium]|nr:BolA family protein [Mariprofundaceae bacterium]